VRILGVLEHEGHEEIEELVALLLGILDNVVEDANL